MKSKTKVKLFLLIIFTKEVLESQKLKESTLPLNKFKNAAMKLKASTTSLRIMGNMKKKNPNLGNVEEDSDIIFTDNDEYISFSSNQESISFIKFLKLHKISIGNQSSSEDSINGEEEDIYEIYMKERMKEKDNSNLMGKNNKKVNASRFEENIEAPNLNFTQKPQRNIEQAMEIFSNISEDTLALLYFVNNFFELSLF